jgi:hypothetical protein
MKEDSVGISTNLNEVQMKVKMTKDDLENWKKFRSSKSSRISKNEVELIAKLYSKYMNKKYVVPCTCNGKRIQGWIDQINKVYEFSVSA